MTRKMIYLALCVTLSLILSLIERSIPVPFMTPGAKLGLSQIIIVFALYTLPSKRDVLMIIVVKLILSSIFGQGVSGFMYSVMGAFFSFIAMLVTKMIFEPYVSVVGVSIIGAVFHHIGQLIIAMWIVQNSGVFLYLPFLTWIGILTGLFVGLVNLLLLRYRKVIPFFKLNSNY